MKKFIMLMAVVMLFAFAQVAMADYSVRVYQNGFSNGNGGEFAITGAGNLGNYAATTKNVSNSPSFESFCLEESEFFTPGALYRAVLNTAAVNGGDTAHGGSPDPLSIGTADLYYQFATGTLAGYFVGNRNTNAGLLQQAIWILEQEVLVDPGTNPFLNAMIAKYGGTLAGAQANSNGAFSVMVLNLYDANGGLAQDQLILTPIPAAVWLLGTGLVALIGIRRRKNS